MTTELRIVVHGVPAPQGSKRHVGNGVMIESSKKVRPWRQDVKYAALQAIEDGAATFPDGGVLIGVAFRLHRPKSHYRSGRHAHLLRPSAPARPSTKPDIDKLARSTLDALGEAGVWKDDAQVVSLWAAKEYGTPGATIIVRSASVLEEVIVRPALQVVT